ncbi:Uncharacterized protein BP5553_08610 [Venustampulla echinocandica]|uniref:Metallo-beta-lactamase domain-containing protein n=1 Tax=Venustampulla echinocandica TaxID=2656787 RepID=A0A370TER8_9HELO|nr:Uncharacterized protein BP5553_08610 [Venustampulla echinocandica]RDL33171.1 Uncharacterized protein BP5553_08610 [Venustampulla echinocandica]
MEQKQIPELLKVSELLICSTCGTQFDTPASSSQLTSCLICDDPRQYVPPSGQSFTTLSELRAANPQNKHEVISGDDRFLSLCTEPRVGIGQRAILIKTPVGNVLWDCITYLDSATVEWINSLGGLGAIVISHPHYYTTHLLWAEAFDCPVYVSSEDKEWLCRLDDPSKPRRRFIADPELDIEIKGQKTGIKILKLGGHFPGSLVCLAYGRLLIADTLMTTPAGLGDWSHGPGAGTGRPKGMNSYSFMWSYPNMIPLSPEELEVMWAVLKKHAFSSTHGAFGQDLIDGYGGSEAPVKKRVLESMQIQTRRMGWTDHAILSETC